MTDKIKNGTALEYFNALWASVEKHMGVDPECAHWPEAIRTALEAAAREESAVFGKVDMGESANDYWKKVFEEAKEKGSGTMLGNLHCLKYNMNCAIRWAFENARGERFSYNGQSYPVIIAETMLSDRDKIIQQQQEANRAALARAPWLGLDETDGATKRTARDGKPIDILLNGDARIPEVYWDAEELIFCACGTDVPVIGAWDQINTITHWMPPPELPAY